MVPQLVKKFPAFHGTLSSITVFATASHWFLLWATGNDPTPFYPIPLTSTLISSYLRLFLSSGLFPSIFRQKLYVNLLPTSCYMSCTSHCSWFNHDNCNTLGEEYKLWSFSSCTFLYLPVTFSLRSKYTSQYYSKYRHYSGMKLFYKSYAMLLFVQPFMYRKQQFIEAAQSHRLHSNLFASRRFNTLPFKPQC
jgi:hypothetical protein